MHRDSDYLRLRDDFWMGFNWKQTGLNRNGFYEWARKTRNPPIHIDKYSWADLQRGNPVRTDTVEAFSEYISEVLELGRYFLSSIAVPCEGAAEPERSKEREADAWTFDYIQLFAKLSRPLLAPDKAYCHNEDDLLAAALMVMKHVALRDRHIKSTPQAILYAETVMHLSISELTALLRSFWQTNPNSVLFAVDRSKSCQTTRVGVTVIVPVTPEFYAQFRIGESEFAAPVDLLPVSPHLWFFAASDNAEIDIRREKARRSQLMIRTAIYQGAIMTPSLLDSTVDVQVITQGGTEEGCRRALSYGYRPLGTVSAVTRKPILEFANPLRNGDGFGSGFAHYIAFRSLLSVFQAASTAQNRLLSD